MLLRHSREALLSKLSTVIRHMALLGLMFSSLTLFMPKISYATVCGGELSPLSREFHLILDDYARIIYELEEAPQESTTQVKLTQILEIKTQELSDLLENWKNPEYSHDKVKTLILRAVHSLRGHVVDEESEARDEEAENIITGSKAIFHRFEPGQFVMRSAKFLWMFGKVEITEPFALMATHTTQSVYKKVAEAANKKFPDKYQINPEPSLNKGGFNIVEQVSYDETMNWISALNDLAKNQDPVIKEIFPQYKPGQIFDLPSDAEIEFVYRGGGNTLNKAKYPLGLKESELPKYAWFAQDPEVNKVQPVATKAPFIINGKKFYDLVGLGWIWTKDMYRRRPPGGKNPVVPFWFDSMAWNEPTRVIRGGGIRNHSYMLTTGYRHGSGKEKSDFVGFRLVLRNL